MAYKCITPGQKPHMLIVSYQQRGIWLAFPVSHCHWIESLDSHFLSWSIGGCDFVSPAFPGQESLIPLQRSYGGAHQCSILESPVGECLRLCGLILIMFLGSHMCPRSMSVWSSPNGLWFLSMRVRQSTSPGISTWLIVNGEKCRYQLPCHSFHSALDRPALLFAPLDH